MRVLTIDFETFWDSKEEYSLKEMSPARFITDPRFEVQILGLREGRGDVVAFTGAEIENAIHRYGIHKPDVCLVGHNIRKFDAKILELHYHVLPKFMMDTLDMGNFLGITDGPGGSHAKLTKYLGNGEKPSGTAVSDGKHWPDDFSLEEQEFFLNYCKSDVLQCSQNFFDLMKMMAALV